MKTPFSEEEIRLWQEMADMTKSKCLEHCPSGMGHCCTWEYCEEALLTAEEYGVEIPMPMVDENGCKVPPHLRPLCSVHQCKIASIGADVDDIPWTKRYFRLRDKLNMMTWEREEKDKEVPVGANNES